MKIQLAKNELIEKICDLCRLSADNADWCQKQNYKDLLRFYEFEHKSYFDCVVLCRYCDSMSEFEEKLNDELQNILGCINGFKK